MPKVTVASTRPQFGRFSDRGHIYPITQSAPVEGEVLVLSFNGKETKGCFGRLRWRAPDSPRYRIEKGWKFDLLAESSYQAFLRFARTWTENSGEILFPVYEPIEVLRRTQRGGYCHAATIRYNPHEQALALHYKNEAVDRLFASLADLAAGVSAALTEDAVLGQQAV